MPDDQVPSAFAVRVAPGRRPRGRLRTQWRAMLAVAVGGAVGSAGRYAIETAWPAEGNAFPWAVFVVNVTGCLVIGSFMVIIDEIASRHRVLRPFVGVGVLGGFTTFSTYAVDAQQLLDAGRAPMALAYMFGTLGAALFAVRAGEGLTRLAVSVAR